MPPKLGGAPKCQKCTKSAYANESLTFNARVFHEACFTCASCGARMRESAATMVDDNVYHTQCAKKLKSLPKAKKASPGSPPAPTVPKGGDVSPMPKVPEEAAVSPKNDAASANENPMVPSLHNEDAIASPVPGEDAVAPSVQKEHVIAPMQKEVSSDDAPVSPEFPPVASRNDDIALVSQSSPQISSGTSSLMSPAPTFSLAQTVSPEIAVVSMPSENPSEHSGAGSLLSPLPTFSLEHTISPELAVMAEPTPAVSRFRFASSQSPPPNFSLERTLTPPVAVAVINDAAQDFEIPSLESMPPLPRISTEYPDIPELPHLITPDSPRSSGAPQANSSPPQVEYPDIPEVGSPCISPSKKQHSPKASSSFPPSLVLTDYPAVPPDVVHVLSPEPDLEVKASELVPSSPSSFWSCNSTPASPAAMTVSSRLPRESPQIAPVLVVPEHSTAGKIGVAPPHSPLGTFTLRRTTTPAISVAPLFPSPPSPKGASPSSPTSPLLRLRAPTPSSSESNAAPGIQNSADDSMKKKLFEGDIGADAIARAQDFMQRLDAEISQGATRTTIIALQNDLAQSSRPAAEHLAKMSINLVEGSEQKTQEAQLLGEMSLIAVFSCFLELDSLTEAQCFTLSPSHWNLLAEKIIEVANQIWMLLDHAMWWQKEELAWLSANEKVFPEDNVRCMAQLAILQMIHARVRLLRNPTKDEALEQEVGHTSLEVAKKLSKIDLAKAALRSHFSLESYLNISSLTACLHMLSGERAWPDKVVLAQLESVSMQCADATTVAKQKVEEAMHSAVQLSSYPLPITPSHCPLDLLVWHPVFSNAVEGRVQGILAEAKRIHRARGEVCVMSCRVLGRMIHALESKIERHLQSQEKASLSKLHALLGVVGRKFGAMCVEAALWKQEQLAIANASPQETVEIEEHIGALSCEGVRYLLHELGSSGSSSESGEGASASRRALSRQLSELSGPASHWLSRETKHLEHLLGQGGSEALGRALEKTKGEHGVLQVIALRQRVMRFVVKVSEGSVDGPSIRREVKRLYALSQSSLQFLTATPPPAFFAVGPAASSTITSISPALAATPLALRWLLAEPDIQVSALDMEISLIRFSMPRWAPPSPTILDTQAKLERMQVCAQAALWHRIEVYMLQSEFSVLGLVHRDSLTSAIACSAAEIGAAMVEGATLGLDLLQGSCSLAESDSKQFRTNMILLFYCFSFLNPVPTSVTSPAAEPLPELLAVAPDLSAMLRVVVNMTPNLHDLEPLRQAHPEILPPVLPVILTLPQLVAFRSEIDRLKTELEHATEDQRETLEEHLWEVEQHLGSSAMQGVRDREAKRGDERDEAELAEFRLESFNFTLPIVESLTRALDTPLTSTRRQEIQAELEYRKGLIGQWSTGIAKWALHQLEDSKSPYLEKAEDFLAAVSSEARTALVAEKQSLRAQLKGDRHGRELRETQHYCELLTIYCAKYKAEEINYLSDMASAGKLDEESVKALSKSREEFVPLSWDATVYSGKQLEALTRRLRRLQMAPQAQTADLRHVIDKARDTLAMISCQAAACRLHFLHNQEVAPESQALCPEPVPAPQLSAEVLRTQVAKLFQKNHTLWQEQIQNLSALLAAHPHDHTVLLRSLLDKFQTVFREARSYFSEAGLSRRNSLAADSTVSSQVSNHQHQHQQHQQQQQHHQQHHQQQQHRRPQHHEHRQIQMTPSVNLANSALEFKSPSLDFARTKQEYPVVPTDTPVVHAFYARNPGRRNSMEGRVVTMHKDTQRQSPISPDSVHIPVTVSPIPSPNRRKAAEDTLEQGVMMWHVSEHAPLHLTFAKLAHSDHEPFTYSIHWVPRAANATAAFGLVKGSKAYFGTEVIKALGLNKRILETELSHSNRSADWLLAVMNPDSSSVCLLCMSESDFQLWKSNLSKILGL